MPIIVHYYLPITIGHYLNGDTDKMAKLDALAEKGGDFNYFVSELVYCFSQLLGQGREIQCDLIALYLGTKAGYDPNELLNFFRKYEEEDPKPAGIVNEIEKELTRSHPWTIERINCLQKYINSYKIEITGLNTINKKGVLVIGK